MRIRYMVDQATWDPSYNIRADGKGGVKVEYDASIQQQSGEDWTNVAMTLSTASPSLAANAADTLAAGDHADGGRGCGGRDRGRRGYGEPPDDGSLEVKQDFAAKRREAEYQRQIAIGNNWGPTMNLQSVTANGNAQGGMGGGTARAGACLAAPTGQTARAARAAAACSRAGRTKAETRRPTAQT